MSDEALNDEGTEIVPAEEQTTKKDLKDTLYFKVSEKIFPGLADAVASQGLKLIDLTVNGASQSRIMGVVSNYESWLESGPLLDVIATQSEGWAGHALKFKPLRLRKFGDRYVMSTNIRDLPIGNNARSMVNVDLTGEGIRFAGDFFGSFKEVYNGGVTTTPSTPPTVSGETWPKGTMSGSTESNGNIHVGSSAIDDAGRQTLQNLLSPMGYIVDSKLPILKASGVPPSGYPNPNKISMTFGDAMKIAKCDSDSGFGYIHADAHINMQRYGAWSSPPGIKYIPFLFNYLDTTSSNTTVVYHIPVIDDGSDKFITLYHCDNSGAQYMIVGTDYRYGGATTGLTVSPKGYMIAKYAGVENFTTPLGNNTLASKLPTSSHDKGSPALGDNILPFLVPPVDNQHIVGSTLRTSEEVYSLNGTDVTLITGTLTSSFYACKLSKEWYTSYYTTGFGLYNPRASNIQKNILDKWNALEFDSFSICIDDAMTTINPEIVSQIPLADEYARIREKACKENDWLDQVYGGNITYGDLKSRISANQKLSAFYSVNMSSESSIFVPEATGLITWTRVLDTSNVASYSRTENDETEVYVISDTTRDLILNEWAESIRVGFASAIFGADFSLNATDIKDIEDAEEAASNVYYKENSLTRGYVLKEQYFSPEESLSMSGYPVYRYMQSPFREQMVMRCYADLRVIGEPLVRIIKSFSDDVVINKILKK